MDKKIYITTPIYYVNDIPHIGHAYTTIAADVLARYYKSQNKEVFFLTGTDEHGAKIAEAAEKAGKEPKEFVDSLVPRFEKAWENLNIKYDGFIRTTDPKHEAVVKEIVTKLKEKGFIEKKKYEGLYCVGCERFLNKDELKDGKCPDHGKEPVKQSEENYFFLLSKFEDKLKKAIDAGDYEIAPKGRKNEVLGKLEQGLEDISISRAAVPWGIEFPDDPEQTIYVWIDALINYYSAGEIFNQKDLWPPTIHLMAKDILWFHAIVWPAVLMALDMELPKKVFAHGFFTIDGKKMSKSVGNVLDPNKMLEKYGADAVRYAILREFPFGEDGDISEEKIASRYNSELASGLGNLVSRVATMIEKYFDNKIPEIKKDSETHPLRANSDRFTWKDAYAEADQAIEKIELHKYCQAIEKFITTANKYIDETKPWVLAKEDKKELAWVLYGLCDSICQLAWLVYPIMPDVSKKIAQAFNIEGLLSENLDIKESYQNIKSDTEIKKPEPLFPRLDK